MGSPVNDLSDQIRLYLPKYLSKEAEENLFTNLKDFPDNLNSRMYTNHLSEDQGIYQGDGIDGLPFAYFPRAEFKYSKGMIITNTCDNDGSNARPYSNFLSYVPIVSLKDWIDKDVSVSSNERLRQLIKDIRGQQITKIFFLPKGGGLKEDSLAFFDAVSSCPIGNVPKEALRKKRLFRLGDYGFYCFLFKLSIHFSRMREQLTRG